MKLPPKDVLGSPPEKSLMEISNPSKSPSPRSLARKVFDVLSGFGLATVTLLLLGLLTWLATLEQIDNGLYPTLNKYFHWKSVFLVPEINGKTIWLPLPGGYWVCAVLLVNLILGGIIRIRKGWQHAGNIIAHFGIIFMLLGAGVSHHFSERGNMAVFEGSSSDAAEDYLEYVVEMAEIKDGKPATIHVIRGKFIDDLGDTERTFKLPALPFDLELGGYLENALALTTAERAPAKHELIARNYYLTPKQKMVPPEPAEQYSAGCYARIVNRTGGKSEPFILLGGAFQPFTWREGDRVFTIEMRKRVWPMPFTVKLDKFIADFHPGTSVAAKFSSDITRLERGGSSSLTISMNNPMRYEGLTFFQASYGSSGEPPHQKMYSVFEIVRNPADQWPKWSLCIVAFGMFVTFMIKLTSFLAAGSRKSRHAK